MSPAHREGQRPEVPAGMAMPAGRVGRPHGLDGGFHVTDARSRLLAAGTPVKIGEKVTRVVDRRGTDERPLLRVECIEDRVAAEAVRGRELMVAAADAPALAEGEWWASELEGCEVVDGARAVGEVVRLVELPSCEALEVRIEAQADDVPEKKRTSPRGRGAGVANGGDQPLLIPLVRDAIRSVDVAAGRIDVDMGFLEE